VEVVAAEASDEELAARISRVVAATSCEEGVPAFEVLLSQLPDGAAIVTRRGEVLALNEVGRSTLRLSGFSSGTHWLKLVTPSRNEETKNLIAQAATGRSARHVDVEATLIDGTRVTLALSFGPLPSTPHLFTSFRDVTSERTTEAALRRTSEFLHHLIDSSSDAIIAADLKGRLLVYNGAAEKMFGIPASEALDSHFVTELYPTGGAQEIMRMLRASPTGHIEAVRAYGKSVTGELIPVELSASLLRMKGEEMASVGLLRDIRERVRVEAELARTRARLIDAEKQREITALAGATAHELNQPLTVIVGRTELLQRKLEGPQRAHVAAIAEQAERMSEIVKRIAKLTHIRTLAYPGELEIADLQSPSDSSGTTSRTG
jgi:PAS domain S-box-containing protein